MPRYRGNKLDGIEEDLARALAPYLAREEVRQKVGEVLDPVHVAYQGLHVPLQQREWGALDAALFGLSDRAAKAQVHLEGLVKDTFPEEEIRAMADEFRGIVARHPEAQVWGHAGPGYSAPNIKIGWNRDSVDFEARHVPVTQTYGPFRVRLNILDPYGMTVETREGGPEHPHASGGSFCLGEGLPMMQSARDARAWSTMIDLANAAIRTYNPTGAYHRIPGDEALPYPIASENQALVTEVADWIEEHAGMPPGRAYHQAVLLVEGSRRVTRNWVIGQVPRNYRLRIRDSLLMGNYGPWADDLLEAFPNLIPEPRSAAVSLPIQDECPNCGEALEGQTLIYRPVTFVRLDGRVEQGVWTPGPESLRGLALDAHESVIRMVENREGLLNHPACGFSERPRLFAPQEGQEAEARAAQETEAQQAQAQESQVRQGVPPDSSATGEESLARGTGEGPQRPITLQSILDRADERSVARTNWARLYTDPPTEPEREVPF